jgi:hypothetical protein
VRTLVEEHGRGRQLVRARLWPRLSVALVAVIGVIGVAAADAVSDGSWPAAVLLIVLGVILAGRAAQESGAAIALATETFERQAGANEPVPVAPPEAVAQEAA